MERRKQDYYLGLDIGTDSVGFAVTDEDYRVLKFNGKSMWGVRLFEAGKTAAETRVFRANRRRLQRRVQRLGLLQDLFSEEVNKVDPGFFIRMKDSMLLAEDKKDNQLNSLFNDSDFSDKSYYKKYPTIYHLRQDLMFNENKFDIRLIYLALHHIIKYRGHFLFPGDVSSVTDFSNAYEVFRNCINDEFELDIHCRSFTDLEAILKSKRITKIDKTNKIMELFDLDNKDKGFKTIISLMCGRKVKLSDIFNDDSYEEIKPFAFSDDNFEERYDEIESVLLDKMIVVNAIKSIYDWSLLSEILSGGEYKGESYISVAKVNLYEKHKEDLKRLKRLIKINGKDSYAQIFKDVEADNYCAYVGFTKKGKNKLTVKKCSKDEFYKRIKKELEKIKITSYEAEIKDVISEIEQDNFLPLQVSKDNSIVPHQVNQIELRKILENAEKYYHLFKQADEQGISVKEKIFKIFEFRVPYYVGPLNTNNSKNSWMIRNESGKIYPWNIDKKIDIDSTAEKFIRRMTNKCTYLATMDVIPKNSILYQEFETLNELNNLKIKGEKISNELKNAIIRDLFKNYKNISVSRLVNYLSNNFAMDVSSKDVSGIDGKFNSSLSTLIDFKKIFTDDIEKHSIKLIIDNITLWITLYSDDRRMLQRVIRKNYDQKIISEEQLKQILNLKYTGWGRLSKEFLNELQGFNNETGEVYTIINALRNTTDNLMQLLSYKYTFVEQVNNFNKTQTTTLENKKDYQKLVTDANISPSLKRPIWQTILIANEIVKIRQKEPNKIFIEMARAEAKKERTTSRKSKLLDLYNKCKDEERDWKAELENRPESDYRSIKLFLYYTQMGRCMYSGKQIDLGELANTDIYDRDHIYPQSKTKDDSINNLVLVDKRINAMKSDGLISTDIQQKMSSFWRFLRDQEFIDKEKYNRLMRRTPLTDEELANFINRQLVETRQSTKFVAEALKTIYPNTEIVYVKSKLAAEFRDENLNMVKVRSINDLHHAKDAYLNIVVGNVYHEKFTSNPLNWLKCNKDKTYSLNRVFDFDLIKNEKVVWKRGKDGSISTVKKFMNKNDVLYTRYSTINKDALFNQQIVSKDDNPSIPIKKGLNPLKYGGYKSITPAYFSLVESIDKKVINSDQLKQYRYIY